MYKLNLLVALFLATFLVACDSSTSAQLEANKALVKRFFEANNNADWDALDDLMAEEFIRHSQSTPNLNINSREKYKDMQKGFLISMPDQKMTVEMMVAERDLVATYVTFTGTFTGPMEGLQPTGNSVDSKSMIFFRIEGNRIAEFWVEWDTTNMHAQMGLIPGPLQ